MKNYFIGISLCFLVSCASAQAQTATDPELDRVIGKVFLILSKQYTVSGQSHGQLSLWANAKLGSVAYPEDMGNPKKRWETEMVPTESGIVLKFNPPFNPDETQKANWGTYHDDEAKKFTVLVPLPGKKVISIMGTYGPNFPREYVDRLIELSKSGE